MHHAKEKQKRTNGTLGKRTRRNKKYIQKPHNNTACRHKWRNRGNSKIWKTTTKIIGPNAKSEKAENGNGAMSSKI